MSEEGVASRSASRPGAPAPWAPAPVPDERNPQLELLSAGRSALRFASGGPCPLGPYPWPRD